MDFVLKWWTLSLQWWILHLKCRCETVSWPFGGSCEPGCKMKWWIFALKTRKFAYKTRNFVFKTRDVVLKWWILQVPARRGSSSARASDGRLAGRLTVSAGRGWLCVFYWRIFILVWRMLISYWRMLILWQKGHHSLAGRGAPRGGQFSMEESWFPLKNPDFLLKNPDFLSKTFDFLLKNVDFFNVTEGAPVRRGHGLRLFEGMRSIIWI